MKTTMTSDKKFDNKVKGKVPQTNGGAIKILGSLISMRQNFSATNLKGYLIYVNSRYNIIMLELVGF